MVAKFVFQDWKRHGVLGEERFNVVLAFLRDVTIHTGLFFKLNKDHVTQKMVTESTSGLSFKINSFKIRSNLIEKWCLPNMRLGLSSVKLSKSKWRHFFGLSQLSLSQCWASVVLNISKRMATVFGLVFFIFGGITLERHISKQMLSNLLEVVASTHVHHLQNFLCTF